MSWGEAAFLAPVQMDGGKMMSDKLPFWDGKMKPSLFSVAFSCMLVLGICNFLEIILCISIGVQLSCSCSRVYTDVYFGLSQGSQPKRTHLPRHWASGICCRYSMKYH